MLLALPAKGRAGDAGSLRDVSLCAGPRARVLKREAAASARSASPARHKAVWLLFNKQDGRARPGHDLTFKTTLLPVRASSRGVRHKTKPPGWFHPGGCHHGCGWGL